MVLSILLKEMRLSWLKDSTMLGQLPFPSKLSLDSRPILQESTKLTTVEKPHKTSTMQSWLLDTEVKMELNSGTLRIHGEEPGEILDTSRLKEEATCALFLNATHIPSSTSAD